MTAEFAVCECCYCGGRIEFDAAYIGSTTTCPHCTQEISLKSDPPKPKAIANLERVMILGLSSGEVIKARGVRLFNQPKLVALNQKKARIVELSGGVSTGIGSIGSLAWVAGTQLAIGMLESILTTSAHNHANRLFQEATQEEWELLQKAEFFEVSQIVNCNMPSPQTWWSEKREKTGMVSLNSKVPPPLTESNVLFVYDGSEFLMVKADCGNLFNVRWSDVVSHRLI